MGSHELKLLSSPLTESDTHLSGSINWTLAALNVTQRQTLREPALLQGRHQLDVASQVHGYGGAHPVSTW